MFKRIFQILLITALLSSCLGTKQHLSDAQVIYNRADESSTHEGVDSSIAEMIIPFKKEMDSQMNAVLGILPEDLIKERPNSNMGNWFCDALLVMARKYHDDSVDFVVQNYGGLRVPFLAKGEITKGKIYELMPFDNKLVILELEKDILIQFIDLMAKEGGDPISQGLSYSIGRDGAENILVRGEELKEGKLYKVALPDYVANGGGGTDFLKSIEQIDTGVFIRDIIIEYLEEMQAASRDLYVDHSKRIF